MNFEDFLAQKKINSQSFFTKEPARWLEWKQLFEQIHPESFVLQKKFIINKIRRLYPFLDD
ncbi:hypothetical protein SAMN05421780_10450 [Flexibacter flexilis DSM 6793]|uniref:Uncharacterized protein n=1 Tax=Flexibacter flexilis DSM 6793 TaxID=927664 RepID=A0A1I1HQ86_9BACT|nr:hypothetical protein [Flexibacter flexilis]SFC26031.1 hypothetical protein SAMN05421780_10450 [Flexibacter flexilis DSM 6793]